MDGQGANEVDIVAGLLAHRCSVVVSLNPFRVCGKDHKKRECPQADFT